MKHEINGDLLILAREYRSLTQTELSKKAHVGQGTVAKIEGGTTSHVAVKVLDKISSALSFPNEFFLLKNESLGFGSSSYFYRKRSKISAAERKHINSVVNIARINLEKMLSMVDVDHTVPLPSFDIDEFDGNAAGVANAVRANWNIPDGPVKNLTLLMERAGILIIPCDFNCTHMDATSMNLNNSMPMVFVNKNLPGDRWRHTLAHELGHLVMHQSHTETMEDEADMFASELLAPLDDVASQLRQVGKIDLNDLLKLKPYWKVSMASLLVRADNAGLITENQKKYLWAMMSKHGFRKVEPEPIQREITSGHKGLVSSYIDGLGYSVEELAETLSIPIDVFLNLHGDGLDRPIPPRNSKLRLVG